MSKQRLYIFISEDKTIETVSAESIYQALNLCIEADIDLEAYKETLTRIDIFKNEPNRNLERLFTLTKFEIGSVLDAIQRLRKIEINCHEK